MKFQKSLEPYLTKLIKLAEGKFGKGRNYVVRAAFWDDGDFEISLNSTWGFTRHEFTYRFSLDNYFYQKVEIEENFYGEIIK
jgi:hypothetical protein